MLDHRNIAELVKASGKWDLSFFVPSQPAFMWDNMEGRRGTLYAIQCQDFCKIGMTTDLPKRFRNIEAGVPLDVALVSKKVVQFAGLAYAEAWMHKQFSDRRAKNEWFKITPEQAIEKMGMASTVAAIYSRKCREWFYADRARKAADPEHQARMKLELAQFAKKFERRPQAFRP